ncbi:MAG TPA: hypothetical protein VF132_13250 [Rudaea sp.]
MKYLIVFAMTMLGLAVAAGAEAAAPAVFGAASMPSADIPAPQRLRSATAVRAPDAPGASVSDADVGDADSFGRNVQWLGVTDGDVELSSDCSGFDPGTACQAIAPVPAVTNFHFTDLGHIALPAKAANSLLCYWFSPILTVSYNNPTATTVVGNLQINPSLTIENPVLATPGLIDPTTGVPFGGSLVTGMTSLQRFQVPLPPGISLFERKRDSAVCIAGFLSRKTLVETYGLTESQAKDFFKKPTTVRLNVAGSSQYVDNASLYFGLRIVGD